MVQHTARRIDYLVGAAQVLARSEDVGSVSAERSQRGPRRDRNRRRLRDDQRTARIEDWRRWDIWHRRDLRGRNSDRQRNSCKRKTANACERHGVILTCTHITLCGIDAFGIAEIAKGLFSCAEQSRVVRSESLKSVNLVPTQRAGMRGVIQAGGRSLWWSQMVRGDPLQNTPRALRCPSHGAMPTLGYVFLRTGLAMEEL